MPVDIPCMQPPSEPLPFMSAVRSGSRKKGLNCVIGTFFLARHNELITNFETMHHFTYASGVWKEKGRVELDLYDHWGPVPAISDIKLKTIQKGKPLQHPHPVRMASCHPAKSIRMHGELRVDTGHTYIHLFSSFRRMSRSILIMFTK